MENLIDCYFDFEFTGLRKNTTAITLAANIENEIFYGIFTDFDQTQIDEWLKENVLANIYAHARKQSLEWYELYKQKNEDASPCMYNTSSATGIKDYIAECFKTWLAKQQNWISHRYNAPIQFRFVGDFVAFDWVLLCDMFGTAFNIPPQIYYIPKDLVSVLEQNDIDSDADRQKMLEYLGVQGFVKHNAISDAIGTKIICENIEKLRGWK